MMCEHEGTLDDEIGHQSAVPASGNMKTCALIYTAREDNDGRYQPEFAQVRDSLRCP